MDEESAQDIFRTLTILDTRNLEKLLNSLELRQSLEVINLYSSNGFTLLQLAAFKNCYKIASFLISFIRRRLRQYLENKYHPRQEPFSLEERGKIKKKVQDTI